MFQEVDSYDSWKKTVDSFDILYMDTWLCNSCYMDLSKLLHTFLSLCQTSTSWSLTQILKLVGWIKAPNQSWVRCAFDNVWSFRWSNVTKFEKGAESSVLKRRVRKGWTNFSLHTSASAARCCCPKNCGDDSSLLVVRRVFNNIYLEIPPKLWWLHYWLLADSWTAVASFQCYCRKLPNAHNPKGIWGQVAPAFILRKYLCLGANAWIGGCR